MAAGKYNIKIEQGATYRQEFIWKDASDTPVDVTGYTARMHIRGKITDDDTLVELTTENDGIILGTTDGKITLQITADATSLYDWTCGVYDLELVQVVGPETFVYRVLQGSVSVSKEVTR